MSITGSVVIGIVSSLIATGILLCFAQLWRKAVLPWFKNLIYHGVRLDGEWKVVRVAGAVAADIAATGMQVQFEMTLQQSADRVTGTVLLAGMGRREFYRVEGEIRDAFFSAIMRPQSPRVIDSGSMLFRIYDDDGLRMAGIVLVNAQKGSEVKPYTLEFLLV